MAVNFFKVVVFVVLLFSCAKNNALRQIKVENSNVTAISLKVNFQNKFFIGAAVNEAELLEQDKNSVALIKQEFNTITPENSLKWMYLNPEKNRFDFSISDRYVAFGLKNKMHIVGHTLVWHSQLADFMNQETSPELMLEHLETYINTVVNRYKGDIDTWDVVNEALNEDGSFRESVFLNVLGESYIEKAFKLAEKADPEANLVYNDYNLYKPSKREGVVKLVKSLQTRGVKIDGVGIQAHWGLKGPSIRDIEDSILAFSELGVSVSFSELDITVLPNPWELEGAEVSQNFDTYIGDPKMNPYPKNLSDEVQLELAKRYEDIFKLFLKHEDKIERVTFWGVTDEESWLNNWPIKNRKNYPLLFDRSHKPKEAYDKIVNLK